MKPEIKSVDQYIASQPKTTQDSLKLVRSAIRKALPTAEETISYKIPAYKLNNAVVIYFAGWKRHYSLYPITQPVIAEFEPELASYEINSKGTLRFPLAEPVPAKLIGRIAKFCARLAGKKELAQKKEIERKKQTGT
jgi:uncharacterized protein YdhG (YjbR/CyaY superfamily)